MRYGEEYRNISGRNEWQRDFQTWLVVKGNEQAEP